jgi:hypothetical protein
MTRYIRLVRFLVSDLDRPLYHPERVIGSGSVPLPFSASVEIFGRE